MMLEAGGKCAQVLEGIHTTERDIGSEVTQVADDRESHERIAVAAAPEAAAAAYPMSSDSEQASQNNGVRQPRPLPPVAHHIRREQVK
jgi:hypothetical protein